MKFQRLRSSKGFTLIEIIFVLAIVAVLAGILVPLAISSLSDAEKARTRSDEDAIASAITVFRKDVSQWPDGTAKDVKYLLVGTNLSGSTTNAIDTADCPTGGTVANGFFAETQCTTLSTTSGGTASTYNAFNHLAINNPNGDASDSSTNDYSTSKWKGPYLAKLSKDAFGKAYVVYMKGIDKNFSGGSTGKGWIISAGPDNALSTLSTDTVLSGDDIGFIFCTKCD